MVDIKKREADCLRLIFDGATNPTMREGAVNALKSVLKLDREQLVDKYTKKPATKRSKSKKTKAELEEQIEDLIHENDELDDEINDLKGEIEDLEDKIKALQERQHVQILPDSPKVALIKGLVQITIFFLLCYFSPFWAFVFMLIFVVRFGKHED